uniref:Secreted protein n=1 Tax=Ditylenchus dipsaci TaxID=166011 RepID=A0A915DJQ2_9BILA
MSKVAFIQFIFFTFFAAVLSDPLPDSTALKLFLSENPVLEAAAPGSQAFLGSLVQRSHDLLSQSSTTTAVPTANKESLAESN